MYYQDKKNKQILKGNEKFKDFMEPFEYYLNADNKDEETFYVLLQNELHSLLYKYINGRALNRKSKFLFPDLMKESSGNYEANIKKISRLLKAGSSFVNLKSIEGMIENGINFYIAALYEVLDGYIKKEPLSDRIQVKCADSYNEKAYKGVDSQYLIPVRMLVNAIKKIKSNYVDFCLHGSMSTRDYAKGFSDVDTLLILKRKTIINPMKLLELQREIYPLTRFFYKLDPLQHHDFFIINEIDMDFYPETYFPLELFDFATSIKQKVPMLNFSLRDSTQGGEYVFWKMCQSLRRFYLFKKKSMTLFDFKEVISYILLLPALFLQIMEKPVYKKYSFEILKKYKIDDCNVLKTASEYRQAWFPDISSFWFFEDKLPYPPELTKKVSMFIINRLAQKITEKEIKLLERGVCFADNLLERSNIAL